jgi:hypothetical protein
MVEVFGLDFCCFHGLHIVLRSAGWFSQFIFRTIETVDGHFQHANPLGLYVGGADAVYRLAESPVFNIAPSFRA